MNNEPVAWMLTLPDGTHDWILDGNGCEGYIPLYTHPVNPKYDPETGEPLIDGYPLFSGLSHPVKELTDEEIEELARKHLIILTGRYGEDSEIDGDINFARAILRKAQEK